MENLSRMAKFHPQCTYTGLHRSLQQECQFVQRNVQCDGESFTNLETTLTSCFLPSIFDITPPQCEVLALGVKQGGIGVLNPTLSTLSNRSASTEMTSYLAQAMDMGQFELAQHHRQVWTARLESRDRRVHTEEVVMTEHLSSLPDHKKRVMEREGKMEVGSRHTRMPIMGQNSIHKSFMMPWRSDMERLPENSQGNVMDVGKETISTMH